MSSTAAWLALTLALSQGAAPCNDGTRVGEWTCARSMKAEQTATSQNGVKSSILGIETQTVGMDATRDDALGLPVTGRETVPSVNFTTRSSEGGKLLIGRLSQESGISAGYEYSRREQWSRRFSFTFDTQWSIRKYQKHRLLAELASGPESPWALAFSVVQRNYP